MKRLRIIAGTLVKGVPVEAGETRDVEDRDADVLLAYKLAVAVEEEPEEQAAGKKRKK